MVFDRRFNADSLRYLAIRLEPTKTSDELRPPLQDYYALLTRSFLMVTRSFLMVLDGSRAPAR